VSPPLIRVDLNPSKKKSTDFRFETWGSTFRPLFWTCTKYHFGSFFVPALPLLCKAPRDIRKFPQKCHKIAGCWGHAVHLHNFQLLQHLTHPLWYDRVYTIGRVNHGLTQRAPVPPLEVLTSALSCSFCWKRQDKVLEAVLQEHVASNNGWLVMLSGPGHSGGDEPGVEAIRGCVHKRHALNTRLSSGTSTGTFAVSADPYRKYQAEAGTKNEPDTFFVPRQQKMVGKSILTFQT